MDEPAPPAPYFPSHVFAPGDRGDLPLPRVFLSPQRYVQGPSVLRELGRHLSLVPARRVALLVSERGSRSEGVALVQGLRDAGVEHVTRIFGGECSLEEVARQLEALAGADVDCVVAAGGGKCIDAGKAVAYRLGVPVVIAPTLASNDAPCSAVSVLYTPQGASSGVEYYPQSPSIVVVDTEVVARAPERYLVAGMGDAMATWYEARVCLENEKAVTTVFARPTLASAAIGETCMRALFERGAKAAAAVRDSRVDDDLEAIVEANTLLSGLGFESGGLAAAHGVAQAWTQLPAVESRYLHGELVAMGTLTQLVLESRRDEAVKVAEFFATVGLPVHLGQLSLSETDGAALDRVAEGTLAFPFIGNMPAPVTAGSVREALAGAHAIGTAAAGRVGDAAWRRLQAG